MLSNKKIKTIFFSDAWCYTTSAIYTVIYFTPISISNVKMTNRSSLTEKKCECKGDIHLTDKAVKCTFCNKNYHIECKGINNKDYQIIKKKKTEWFCDSDCKNTYEAIPLNQRQTTVC